MQNRPERLDVFKKHLHGNIFAFLPAYDPLGGAPGGNGGKSSSCIFLLSGGVTSLKLPNLSNTTCPGVISGFVVGAGGSGFSFFGSSISFLGRGSFMAIALRTLIFFSAGGGGGGIFFIGSSKSPFLFVERLSWSSQSSLSGFFLKRELPDVALPICIFHLAGAPLAETEAAASATACLAFCSLVGDGESSNDRFGLSLSSLLVNKTNIPKSVGKFNL